MSTIAVPAALIAATNFSLLPFENEAVNAAPFGGSEQVIDFLQHRWIARVDIGEKSYDEAQQLDAFFAQMRRRSNVAALYHYARPAPLGTARGAITLSGAVAQGAQILPLTGISPSTGTLKIGDILGVAGMWFMVAQDATAVAGAMSVSVTNPTRKALSSGASVTWDKPSVLCRMMSSAGINYIAERSSPASFDFVEAVT